MLLKYIGKLIAICKIIEVLAHILTWSVSVLEDNFKMDFDILRKAMNWNFLIEEKEKRPDILNLVLNLLVS
jgi:hypothetical protein